MVDFIRCRFCRFQHVCVSLCVHNVRPIFSHWVAFKCSYRVIHCVDLSVVSRTRQSDYTEFILLHTFCTQCCRYDGFCVRIFKILTAARMTWKPLDHKKKRNKYLMEIKRKKKNSNNSPCDLDQQERFAFVWRVCMCPYIIKSTVTIGLLRRNKNKKIKSSSQILRVCFCCVLCLHQFDHVICILNCFVFG